MNFTEADYEDTIIKLFENMGYTYIYEQDLKRKYTYPFLEITLCDALMTINKNVCIAGLNEAIYKLQYFENASLLQKNKIFMNYLQNGISVKYFEDGKNRSTLVKIIDYENIDNNTFNIVNQWTFTENNKKRLDIVLFINGLPLVIMELKSPQRENANTSQAYNQIRNYMQDIPTMFIYNVACVISDLAISKIGTITSKEDRFMTWKTKDGSYENTDYAQYNTFFEGIFDKVRFLDIIKNFCLFAKEDKIFAGYHQYFAVKKAIEQTKKATNTDGKGGVFWHTQGSGKSLSMVFYAHLLQSEMKKSTIIVLTDRIDLDNQLFLQFSKCKEFLRQTPKQAKNRVDLQELLNERKSNGIFFSTMQKFQETNEPLSTRKDIIVIADEAHRGQYGLNEKINTNGEIQIGMARIIRDSLPNATYIGFTGTPISKEDKSTTEVFGDYIDIYDITQSIKDGATRPIYYESRVIKLNLDENILKEIDNKYEEFSEIAEDYNIERSKKELGKVDAVLGAEETINSLVNDIVQHYEENRENLLTGKAMIVAYSRSIAIKIYKKILEIRPKWKTKVKIVVTSDNKDPEDWKKILDKNKNELAKKFKDDNDNMKIAIVVDMWLTGFDIPSLATMYVYKPMRGHNLMQAIARVNRVFENKEGGLIVDYVGIAGALKQAMKDYTKRDNNNYGDNNIETTIKNKFLEKLDVCESIFHNFDYTGFDGTDNDVRVKKLMEGVNFILEKDTEDRINYPKNEKFLKDCFLKEVLLLKQALSLCSSIIDKEKRLKTAFFDAIRTIIVKISSENNNKFSIKEMNKTISELLEQSIKSDGIFNLFSDVEEEISIFDPKFLVGISKMKEKNLAIELLKKLLNDQVRLYKSTNLVKSQKFSEKISNIINKYLNALLTNEQVIDELINLAKDIKQNESEAKKLNLTQEELAFYDAITKPENIKDFYENEQLIQITKELTEMLRKNRTVDWNKKESARARMRLMIKKLLKRYGYPPEKMKGVENIVIEQCELWANNTDF